MNKPIFFCDLDDTLFQTHRKMIAHLKNENQSVAALDRSFQPLSFFNTQQKMFVQWLLENSHFVPVTARDTSQMARVQIPFHSWQITTHGAVIIMEDGSVQETWKGLMMQALQPYQERILALKHFFTQAFEKAGISASVRINYEYKKTPVYLIAKHTNGHQAFKLHQLVDQLQDQIDLSGFYVHKNDNNISWLPTCVQKGKAVSFVMEQMIDEYGFLPIIGLGDSLSDMSFLNICHWFGMPNKSQLANHLMGSILGDEK